MTANGTADVVMDILMRQLGAGLHHVKRFKTDNGSNLKGGIIREISQRLKIWQDSSSAYHAAGNKLIENSVGRIKKAIGTKKFNKSMMDIIALNLSPPYNNKTLTPFEELHAFISPVNGIPMTDNTGKEMIERKWLSNKKQKMEMKNTTPTTKTPISEDGHNQTQEEREKSKDWVEKIHGRHDQPLTCGDRVFYVDPQEKGAKRWRTGLILLRKQDYLLFFFGW